MQENLKDCKVWKPELCNISEKAIIGRDTVIHAGVHIHDQVQIGRSCQIEAGAFLPNGVTLEDNVFVGPNVCFTNDPTLNESRETWSPTRTLVLKNVKIGANATIRAGVVIGESAVIGCGSVVLKNVPTGERWAGNPAKEI